MSEEPILTPEPESEPEVETSAGSVADTAAAQVQGETINVSDSLVGAVSAGQNVSVSDSLVIAAMAGGNVHLEDGAATSIMAGANVDVLNGGSGFITAGANVTITNGGGGIIACRQASVEQSTIGVLITGQVELGENNRVMFTTLQAAAFGAAFGLVVAALGIIFRRRGRCC